MDTMVKRNKYVEIDELFQTRRELTLKNNASKINVYKDAIELLFYLGDVLQARLYEETEKSGKLLDEPKVLIPILYDRNNHYLIAAYKLTSNCLINPAYLNLRVVFETIAKMYLLHLTKKEADLLYKKQLDMLSKDEKKDLNKNYGGLKPFKVREILYCGKMKEQIDKLYGNLSNSAHPSIVSANSDFIYRDDTVADALNLTLALSSANLIVIYETYFDKFNKEDNSEIKNTLDKIAEELGGVMINMIPNNLKKNQKLSYNKI